MARTGRPPLPESEITTLYYLHRKKVAAALGRPIPAGAVVHHLDEDPTNNENSNLVLCPDEAYHNLIHLRTEAYKACGNPWYRRCYVCKDYDDTANLLVVRKAGRAVTTFYHSVCRNAYRRAMKEAK